jgi:LysR family glycine cleavage system transcriptional activator
VALIADDVVEGRLVKPFAGPTLPEWRYFAYLRRERGDMMAAFRFRDWLAHAERGTEVFRVR